MPLPSFIFNAGEETPEQLQRRRALAEAMLNRGQTGSASSIGEGLAQFGQALAGRLKLNSVDKKIAGNRSKAYEMLGMAMPPVGGGGDASAPASPAAQNVLPGPFPAPPRPTPASGGGSVGMANLIRETAADLGIPAEDLATAISYETAGTFDPSKKGPRTKWGQHKGLIQFGEPQAKQYGVDWNDPIGSQLGKGKAISQYLRAAGVKPGMGMMDVYSAINAGRVGRYKASDAAAGGAPGTVADKVNGQMAGHRAKALAMLGGGGAGGGGGGMAPSQAGAVPPGFMLVSEVENGQFVQKIVPDPRNTAGVQPGLSAPPMGGPRPQPGLSSPPVPPQMPPSVAPSQASPPAPPPQVQPAVGPAPAPIMPQQRPWNGSMRSTLNQLERDGGIDDPRNRAMAQQAGLLPGGPPQAPQASQGGLLSRLGIGAPEAAAPPQKAPMAPPQPSQGMAMPAPGNQLAKLHQFITSGQLGNLEPQVQQFVMGEYERLRQEAAPPDPMKQAQLEKLNLDIANARNPKPDPTDDMREYDFAVSQGYKGTFPQFMLEMKKAGASNVNVNNGSEVGTITPGYELFTDPKTGARSMRPIAGGPAALEAEAAKSKSAQAETNQQMNADIVTEDIDRALGVLDSDAWYNPASGLGSATAGKVAGSKSAQMLGLLDTIEANVGFDKLSAMRAASPTGGALGSVTERELALLSSTLGSVKQSQGEEQLRYNLNRLWNTYQDIVHGPGKGPERRNAKPGASPAPQLGTPPATPDSPPLKSDVTPQQINGVKSMKGFTSDEEAAAYVRKRQAEGWTVAPNGVEYKEVK